MALLDFLFKNRANPFAPPVRRGLPGHVTSEGEIPGVVPQMPDGIDFSTLWLEPTDASMLPMVFSGIAAFCSLLVLVLKLFGH
jgi:hypothetical protein